MHKNGYTNLAKYRLDRAQELLKDAEQLFSINSYKSANNRAYYSIFCAMRAVLALEGADYKKHSGVIQHFQREYIKTGIFDKIYSRIIIEANEIRNASDYDDFYIASREETGNQICAAKQFYYAVEEYLQKELTIK